MKLRGVYQIVRRTWQEEVAETWIPGLSLSLLYICCRECRPQQPVAAHELHVWWAAHPRGRGSTAPLLGRRDGRR